MATFEGLRIYKLEEMIPGQIYFFWKEDLKKDSAGVVDNGIPFIFNEVWNKPVVGQGESTIDTGGPIYVGETLKENMKFLLDGKVHQEEIDKEEAALYLLSELKC